MIIRKYYITNDQYRFLKKLGGNESEHVRASLDMYIEKKKRSSLNVSESLSKGGDENG
jgi:hypothetical protein